MVRSVEFPVRFAVLTLALGWDAEMGSIRVEGEVALPHDFIDEQPMVVVLQQPLAITHDEDDAHAVVLLGFPAQ